jgi:hypothetical protein
MTVAAIAPLIEYQEDGVTLAFPVPFRFLAPQNLLAERTDPAGIVSQLTYGTDYTATGGGTDAGGTLTLAASLAGAKLAIRRGTPRAQTIDYQTNDRFPAETHELGLDRDMMIEQEQDAGFQDLEDRALTVPPGETVPDLPPADERAQGLLGFDANGDPVIIPWASLGAPSGLMQRHESAASAGQTTFQTSVPYMVGFLAVYVNGVRLSVQEFTATDGANVVLDEACLGGDLVLLEWALGSGTATARAGGTRP